MHQTTFQLSSQNYHSNEANQQYMSVSQFKSAMECEARTFAEIRGEFSRPPSTALLIGSYLHAAFESDKAFTEFLEKNHNSIYGSRGGKYKDYEKADDMIETIKNDEFCMFALQGGKEAIYTGELFGVEWKIKVDNINHDRGFFSDLKSTQELSKRYWSEKYNTWVSFVQAFDYVLQMWVYREIIFQNTGRYYDPYIVAVTKESPPDKAVLHFDSERFDFEKEYVQTMLPSIIDAKLGRRNPHRCDKCEFCRATKKLNGTFEIEYLLD
ncbi:PD-(D/E)XK nuclease-like domain-containing protein [Lysinibacillus fusiformis]|uniref:PD-(D/E)XK nuclease-like domain-containing protein n=1 Tax=Lysinibacillus fusiformis TaxID=28031 RepID=UPI0020A4D139|nr:PD-(D/E)XK nuclease-like domain-containing protein [Lysinibacillus fusiformis]